LSSGFKNQPDGERLENEILLSGQENIGKGQLITNFQSSRSKYNFWGFTDQRTVETGNALFAQNYCPGVFSSQSSPLSYGKSKFLFVRHTKI
jgi:hypothetical protein